MWRRPHGRSSSARRCGATGRPPRTAPSRPCRAASLVRPRPRRRGGRCGSAGETYRAAYLFTKSGLSRRTPLPVTRVGEIVSVSVPSPYLRESEAFTERRIGRCRLAASRESTGDPRVAARGGRRRLGRGVSRDEEHPRATADSAGRSTCADRSSTESGKWRAASVTQPHSTAVRVSTSLSTTPPRLADGPRPSLPLLRVSRLGSSGPPLARPSGSRVRSWHEGRTGLEVGASGAWQDGRFPAGAAARRLGQAGLPPGAAQDALRVLGGLRN